MQVGDAESILWPPRTVSVPLQLTYRLSSLRIPVLVLSMLVGLVGPVLVGYWRREVPAS